MEDIPFEKTLDILKRVEIFSRVPASVIEEIGKNMSLPKFDTEERIITQGEKGDSMYVILAGQVKVHDKEFVVAEMEEGNFFGEFSLLDDEPRSLSITAMKPTITGRISREEFYQLLNKYPDVTRDIIKVILKRLRTQNRKIVEQLKQRQKELEELVNQRTHDLVLKNEELVNTLNELKRTQEQLVRQEKLASLGQLTAGIAHEIKNPLNFVNNFSQLSVSLLDELLEAKSDEEKKEIADDLKQNLSKIHHHGKRADGIVKSMLEHARTGTGERQSTDINHLCDEYLTLAYHGVKANDPEFKCRIEKDFEKNLPEIKVVTQDIARVLLNLFSNSFDALKTRPDAK
ncbi:MAG: cyclic nucleotide-binding domain-containing protein, partial [Chitinophagales bacterium]